jgi:hypothetical protein
MFLYFSLFFFHYLSDEVREYEGEHGFAGIRGYRRLALVGKAIPGHA